MRNNGTFVYFCINENGEKFNFRTNAYLDAGTVIKDDNGLKAVIQDSFYDEPFINAGALHEDFEIFRTMA